jgi:hypothetical protein
LPSAPTNPSSLSLANTADCMGAATTPCMTATAPAGPVLLCEPEGAQSLLTLTHAHNPRSQALSARTQYRPAATPRYAASRHRAFPRYRSRFSASTPNDA